MAQMAGVTPTSIRVRCSPRTAVVTVDDREHQNHEGLGAIGDVYREPPKVPYCQ